MTEQGSHQLNLAVARLLGLLITTKHISPAGCYPKRVEDEPFEQMYRLSRETVCAGSKPLRPYHQDEKLAVAALGQICDERGLDAEPYRVSRGKWVVELFESTGNREPVAYGRDDSLALAICKALSQLEKEK